MISIFSMFTAHVQKVVGTALIRVMCMILESSREILWTPLLITFVQMDLVGP